MSLASDPLPTNPEELRQFAASLQAELAREEIEIAANAAEIHAKTLHIEQLQAQLAVLRRARFGRSSEKLDREIERLELLIGDLEEMPPRRRRVPRPTKTSDPMPTRRHNRGNAAIRPEPRCRRICHARPSRTSRSAPARDAVAACSAASGRTNAKCWNMCAPASR